MAISHNLKFARGTSTKRATTTSTLSAGQPFYETDTHRLYVGATDSTSLKDMSLQGCFFDAETVGMLIKASNLEKASWATIKSVSDMGLGGAVWAVGDTKSIALSGTVVDQTVPEVVSAVIIGFDHNSSVEGTGVTFQFGFIDDGEQAKHVALVASNYGNYGSGFCMNTTDTNVGDWALDLVNVSVVSTASTCAFTSMSMVGCVFNGVDNLYIDRAVGCDLGFSGTSGSNIVIQGSVLVGNRIENKTADGAMLTNKTGVTFNCEMNIANRVNMANRTMTNGSSAKSTEHNYNGAEVL